MTKGKKVHTFNNLAEAIAALKVKCDRFVNSPQKNVIKETQYIAPLKEFLQKGDINVIFEFIDRVNIIYGADAHNMGIMHLAAIYGDPTLFKFFVDYNPVAKQRAQVESVLNLAALGRVAPENVEALVNYIRAWDPIQWERAVQDKFQELFDRALQNENYGFYSYLCKVTGKWLNNPLAKMVAPEHRLENDYHKETIIKYSYSYGIRGEEPAPIIDKSIPSLKQMCLSVIKVRALTEPAYRKDIRNNMPREILQLFVDCLPDDAHSARLLDFFSGTPGITVDARQHYWALCEQERAFEKLVNDKFFYQRYPFIYSVYDNVQKFKHPPKDKYDDPATVMRVFDNFRPYSGCPIVNYKTFKSQFDTFTHKLFEGANWSNMVVLGGAVLGSILPKVKGEANQFKASDIDVFFYGVPNVADRILELLTFLKNKFKDILILTTHETVTVCLHYPNRRVQIHGRWPTLDSILMDVDIDCTGLAYDGNKVWASPRAILSLNRNWSVITAGHYQIRGYPAYEERLYKYAHRGFTIVDFNCPRHVDVAKANEYHKTVTEDPANRWTPRLTGLLLLLVVQANYGEVDLNEIFLKREEDPDLPPISREMSPRRIKADIDKGKYVYHSYGERIVAYRSRYTPVTFNFVSGKGKQKLSISHDSGRHFVDKSFLYRGLLPITN